MNMAELDQINPYCWSMPKSASEQQGGIRFYGSKKLIEAMDEKVKEQIRNVARLPGLVGSAMTMPDAHWGYGFPIGGVAAFDADAGGIISAGGVGFDISCGIRCLRSDINFFDCRDAMEPLANELSRLIPAGVGREGKLKLSQKEIDLVLEKGARWATSKGYGTLADLDYIEENGTMKGAIPALVSDLAKQRQLGEMGTLGSGNHYLELQLVEKIYDEAAAKAYAIHEGQLLVSIHCGSRGLGHQIGTDYLKAFLKAAPRFGIHLPDRELACAPIHSPEGKAYLGAMRAGINCALANRQILTQLTRDAFNFILPGVNLTTLFDVSHNTCKVEKHTVEGKEKMVYVHRKGATRAFGPGHPDIPSAYRQVGQPVIIGGSMGTASYILAGNPASQNHAFGSASHGAGRAMSRHQALKHWRGTEVIKELQTRGILIRSHSMRSIAEEAPEAYKDVNWVAEATEQAGLARRVALLRPKVCVKG